jgi:hypothetical protein
MRGASSSCESCGMPIETGHYCRYCVDDNGDLQTFEDRFARMGQFMKQREPDLEGTALESRVLDHMANMPAWRDHPRVVAHRETK